MQIMVEWPRRCSHCGLEIEDWPDAGLFEGRWVHKRCYTQRWNEAHDRGETLPELQSPAARSRVLELPMLVFLLLFHFGLGAAIAGWIMLEQDRNAQVAAVLLVVGLVVPLVGLAGVVVNIISRRRVELIRQLLDTQGGWTPERR
jgi:hypothetical protein